MQDCVHIVGVDVGEEAACLLGRKCLDRDSPPLRFLAHFSFDRELAAGAGADDETLAAPWDLLGGGQWRVP